MKFSIINYNTRIKISSESKTSKPIGKITDFYNWLNPHDRFAKEVLSVHANAKDFLKGILPKEIAEQLDLTTLKRDTENYSDETLTEYFSDMEFTCRSGTGTVKISLLFEHKSFPLPFRAYSS